MAGSMYATTGLFAGEGTWDRVARRVVLLAAEQGITLDAEALLLRDVRELQMLAHRLQSERHRHGWRRWLGG